jgi:hypothetical protein
LRPAHPVIDFLNCSAAAMGLGFCVTKTTFNTGWNNGNGI